MQPPPPPAEIMQIGHDRLDDDHEEFVAIAVRLRDATGEAVLPAFAALHAHARAHFAMEDELMAPHDFASKECHVDEHAAVLQSFEEVGAALHAGQSALAARFAAQLLAWLPEHVDALDRHLAKFIFFKQTGGAPVLLRRDHRKDLSC